MSAIQAAMGTGDVLAPLVRMKMAERASSDALEKLAGVVSNERPIGDPARRRGYLLNFLGPGHLTPEQRIAWAEGALLDARMAEQHLHGPGAALGTTDRIAQAIADLDAGVGSLVKSPFRWNTYAAPPELHSAQEHLLEGRRFLQSVMRSHLHEQAVAGADTLATSVLAELERHGVTGEAPHAAVQAAVDRLATNAIRAATDTPALTA